MFEYLGGALPGPELNPACEMGFSFVLACLFASFFYRL